MAALNVSSKNGAVQGGTDLRLAAAYLVIGTIAGAVSGLIRRPATTRPKRRPPDEIPEF
jgi:hypothetical protein